MRRWSAYGPRSEEESIRSGARSRSFFAVARRRVSTRRSAARQGRKERSGSGADTLFGNDAGAGVSCIARVTATDLPAHGRHVPSEEEGRTLRWTLVVLWTRRATPE
jgi:hypothetical protein